MNIEQGLIVDINFLFPDGKFKPHPAIIVSNNNIYEDEGFFYCVLLTTKNYNTQYTFELTNDMITKPMTVKSYVKCHIIGGYTERDINKTYGHVKPEFFKKIQSKIIKSIF